jgi:hypothetical protein
MLTRNIQNKKMKRWKQRKSPEKKKIKKEVAQAPTKLWCASRRRWNDPGRRPWAATSFPHPPLPHHHITQEQKKKSQNWGRAQFGSDEIEDGIAPQTQEFQTFTAPFNSIWNNRKKIKKVPPHGVPSPSPLRASITTAKMISDMSFKPEIPRPNQTRECSHIKAERPTFEIPFKTTFSTSCFYE